MTYTVVDHATWARAEQFKLFRTFERPHFAVTSRIDVTPLIRRKGHGASPYRDCLFAIGAAVHSVPELCMRIKDDLVVRYTQITLSMTVPKSDGGFDFGYVDYHPDPAVFDRHAAAQIALAARGEGPGPNLGGRIDFAFLSCMPWMDYTSLSNAMPNRADTIPRISWGKFVDQGGKWDMAMTIEVNHALADGAHVGAFFSKVQATIDHLAVV